MSAPLDVLAYGVIERDGGPVVALKFDREDASDWIVSASSEHRNQRMKAPPYRTIELIDAAAVAELVETQRRMIEAFGERYPPGNGHETGRLCEDERQLPVVLDAMSALARFGGAK